MMAFDRLSYLANREFEEPRSLSRQTMVAAMLATLLAGVGLAGTLAENAARQRRDWGIRIALGAGPGRLACHVLGELGWILAPGLALGTLLSWGLGRILQHQFPGTDLADPLLLGGAGILLALAAVAAGTLPALHVLGIRPAESLRAE
jgi:ABC-type antimicrobial peptide transport system permease subunit